VNKRPLGPIWYRLSAVSYKTGAYQRRAGGAGVKRGGDSGGDGWGVLFILLTKEDRVGEPRSED